MLPRPLFVLAVSLSLSAVCHAADPKHALLPSAPRTVILIDSQTPPVVRAGLLQSTLILLPAEEKVATVFGGDTSSLGLRWRTCRQPIHLDQTQDRRQQHGRTHRLRPR